MTVPINPPTEIPAIVPGLNEPEFGVLSEEGGEVEIAGLVFVLVNGSEEIACTDPD